MDKSYLNFNNSDDIKMKNNLNENKKLEIIKIKNQYGLIRQLSLATSQSNSISLKKNNKLSVLFNAKFNIISKQFKNKKDLKSETYSNNNNNNFIQNSEIIANQVDFINQKNYLVKDLILKNKFSDDKHNIFLTSSIDNKNNSKNKIKLGKIFFWDCSNGTS